MGTRDLDPEQLAVFVTVLAARVGDTPIDPSDTRHALYMAAYLRVHARHAASSHSNAAFLRLTSGQLDALADWCERASETLKPV